MEKRWSLTLGFLVVTVSHCSESKLESWTNRDLDYGTRSIQVPDSKLLELGRNSKGTQCFCGSCFDCLQKTKKIACEGDLSGCGGCKKSKCEVWLLVGATAGLSLATYLCLRHLSHCCNSQDNDTP